MQFVLVGGESIYAKNMVNLEQIGTKGFSTVLFCIGLAEQHSKNRGNLMCQNMFFFNFKF